MTGPPGSGRSTALVTLAQAMRRRHPDARIVHLAPSASTIATLDVWSETASGQEPVMDLVNTLLLDPAAGSAQRLMVVIEGVAEFGGTGAENELAQLVKALGDTAFVVGRARSQGGDRRGCWPSRSRRPAAVCCCGPTGSRPTACSARRSA